MPTDVIRAWAIRNRIRTEDAQRQRARELVWALLDGRAFVVRIKEQTDADNG